MLLKVLFIIFLLALGISLVIKFTVFYHFKRFSLPQDPHVKRIISLHKWGTIIIALFCVLLLALALILT